MCDWKPGNILVIGSILGIFSTGIAHAQTPTPVTAASGVTFTASADHAALNLDGSAVVTNYEVRFLPGAGCAAIPAANINKPAPVGGVISVKPVAGFGALTANCTYTGVVAAIGPGGAGVSLPSDPFVRVVARVPAAPGKPAAVP